MDTPCYPPLPSPDTSNPPFPYRGGQVGTREACREVEHPCLQNRDCARGLLSVLWSTRGVFGHVFGPFFLSPNPPQGPSCPLTYFDARPVSSRDLRSRSALQIWNSPPGPAFLHPQFVCTWRRNFQLWNMPVEKMFAARDPPVGLFWERDSAFLLIWINAR